MHPSQDSATTGGKMSSDVSTGQGPVLNPTSSDKVHEYQEMFSSRYSNDDKFFKPYLNKGMDPPPIIEDYFIRPQKRSWHDSNRDQRSYQDRGYGQNYQSKRQHYDHGSHHHDRGGSQQWGHTSHNQDWRQRDRQGQGSQPQRDRYSDGRHDRHDERHQDSRNQSQRRNSSHQRHDEWT